MKKIFSKIILWVYIKFHSIFLNISIALFNTDMEILKANPDDLNEKDKKTTRKLHHNKLLEKFYAGQRDERYMKEYYELLKKADKFVREASAHRKAVAADRWGMSVGLKDKYGRRLDHVGFFDDQHKHHGKTMKEVLEAEMLERRTNDDDYELLGIFNNLPIETGLSKIEDVVDTEYKLTDLANKSKTLEFPITATRDVDVANKIEQLTEFLHVKRIGFDHRLLEFFIPLKYKTTGITESDKVFNEIVTIKNLFINEKYGELIGFVVNGFEKRITYKDTHEVWKFNGIEMEIINEN